MKKFTLTLFVIFFGIISIFAQAPQTFKYQAVARDNLGKIIVTQIVGLRISILKDSPLGATMYMETHSRGTNEFGIVTLNVGGGTIVTGSFNTINWSNGEYFIKTELDIAGTGNYEFIGTTQLLSVPFALYANEAGKAKNDNDTSATNELQIIEKTGNIFSLSQGGGSVTDSDNQILNLNGFDLSISGGNTIQLPPDADHDTLNEIQAISKTGNQITLSKNGGSITDSDNQTLSLNGNQLTISDGNTLTLSGAVDLDSDPTNELQLLNKSNDTLYLSQGNFVVFPHDADRDSTNEIQVLQLNQNVLSLSKANAVNIDADTTNEIQNLILAGDTLKISQSNQVIFPHDNDLDNLNEIQHLSISNDTLNLSLDGNVKLPYYSFHGINGFENDTTWVVPSNVYSVNLKVIGGGGAGASFWSPYGTAWGGAAGGYAENVVKTKPGDVFTIVVGTGGTSTSSAGNNGNSSIIFLNGTNIIYATGGQGGPTGDTTSPIGGIGYINFLGGIKLQGDSGEKPRPEVSGSNSTSQGANGGKGFLNKGFGGNGGWSTDYSGQGTNGGDGY